MKKVRDDMLLIILGIVFITIGFMRTKEYYPKISKYTLISICIDFMLGGYDIGFGLARLFEKR